MWWYRSIASTVTPSSSATGRIAVAVVNGDTDVDVDGNVDDNVDDNSIGCNEGRREEVQSNIPVHPKMELLSISFGLSAH